MTVPNRANRAPPPRWDGRSVLFEFVDSGRSVTCAVSLGAIRHLGGRPRHKPDELLKCFAALRSQIEAVAIAKFRSQSLGASGVLNLWSNDFEDSLPADSPVVELEKSLEAV